MSVRISIKVESGRDKIRGKMNQRSQKLNKRAIRARKNRKGRVNKKEHTTKSSYKPSEPKMEKQTKSRRVLNHELKKIENIQNYELDMYYQYMKAFFDNDEQQYYQSKLLEEEEFHRSKLKLRVIDQQIVNKPQIRNPKYIGEQKHYNEVSWGGLEDNHDLDIPSQEQIHIEAYERHRKELREKRQKEIKEQEQFQFWNW